MAQNTKLIATLSKGGDGSSSGRGSGGSADGSGGGSGGGGSDNNDGRIRTPWKEINSAQIASRQWSTNRWTASPSRQTRTNVQQDGASNKANDRDRGPALMTVYNNG